MGKRRWHVSRSACRSRELKSPRQAVKEIGVSFSCGSSWLGMFKRRPSFSSPRLASSTLVHDPPIQKMEKMEQSVQHVDDVAVISCCPRSKFPGCFVCTTLVILASRERWYRRLFSLSSIPQRRLVGPLFDSSNVVQS